MTDDLDATRRQIAAEHGLSDEDVELFLAGTNDPDRIAMLAQRLAARSVTAPGGHQWN